MSASSTPAPLERVPPGVWPALTWCAAALHPVVVFVLLPTGPGHSASYPRDGLSGPAARVLMVLAFASVLAGCAFFRRRPVAAYGLVLLGTVVLAAAWRQSEIPPLQFLGVDVALAGVAAVRPRRDSLYAAGAALGVLGGFWSVRMLTGGESGTAGEPFVALTVAVAWLAGHAAHQSRAHAAELRERSAAEAVTAERLRIAREMHDTVAHSLGIIALQAGAAARVMDTRPELAREAMVAVERAGRETLGGLRRILGALRAADDAPDGAAGPAASGGASSPASFPSASSASSASASPASSASASSTSSPSASASGDWAVELERLAEVTTAAGVRVEVDWRGARDGLPQEVGAAAFRIVQEAVTNVLRHSGTRSCQVRVDHREDELRVEVRDRGRGGVPRPGPGFGLTGLRERATLLGGDLDAGPCPGGGFRVAARVPLGTGAAGRALGERAGEHR
ncbi:sensor histidine kinase [Streptomyces abyssomicinicus]|uniref:sensor histidine kinase n=1 Tax=Streptomyces abyssomicinicus TaxID=574929 RepID=UPI0012507EC9|nr:histidine kinase [Streptomyces abyssomicinicus]